MGLIGSLKSFRKKISVVRPTPFVDFNEWYLQALGSSWAQCRLSWGSATSFYPLVVLSTGPFLYVHIYTRTGLGDGVDSQSIHMECAFHKSGLGSGNWIIGRGFLINWNSWKLIFSRSVDRMIEGLL